MLSMEDRIVKPSDSTRADYTPPILIITPIKPGAMIAPCTLPYPRLVAGVEPKHKVREVNINLSRSYCQEEFLKHWFHQYEFVLLMDADVVIDPDVVGKLLVAWKEHTTPCANTKSGAFNQANPYHGPVTSCALIHRADYERVDYLEKLAECQCHKLPKPFYVEGARGYESKYR